jgi:hypothetical protein
VDVNFVDPDDIPRPPDEVRLRSLDVTPLGDGRRVRVEIQITPFLQRPNVDLDLTGPSGESLSRTTVVEADSPRFSLTMHLRRAAEGGEYVVRGALSYASDPPQDVREQRFVVEASDAAPE